MIKEARIISVVPLFPMPQYVVVLEDIEKSRLVPIWIGVHEGNAISLVLQGEKYPRPLTHDLFSNVLTLLNVKIEKIVVSDIVDGSYYAIIYLNQNGNILQLDARPSDSLALAVRVKCPIYIDDKVLKKCPIIEKPITKDEIDNFKKELKNMSPEEFFKNLEESETIQDPDIPKKPDQSSENENEGDDDEGDDDENK